MAGWLTGRLDLQEKQSKLVAIQRRRLKILAAPLKRSTLVVEDRNRIARIRSQVLDNLTVCTNIASDDDSDGELEIILADDLDLFASDDDDDDTDTLDRKSTRLNSSH